MPGTSQSTLFQENNKILHSKWRVKKYLFCTSITYKCPICGPYSSYTIFAVLQAELNFPILGINFYIHVVEATYLNTTEINCKMFIKCQYLLITSLLFSVMRLAYIFEIRVPHRGFKPRRISHASIVYSILFGT